MTCYSNVIEIEQTMNLLSSLSFPSSSNNLTTNEPLIQEQQRQSETEQSSSSLQPSVQQPKQILYY